MKISGSSRLLHGVTVLKFDRSHPAIRKISRTCLLSGPHCRSSPARAATSAPRSQGPSPRRAPTSSSTSGRASPEGRGGVARRSRATGRQCKARRRRRGRTATTCIGSRRRPARSGRSDILVNSVGIATDGEAARHDRRSAGRQVLKTSLYSVFYCTREVRRAHGRSARWGRIINIGGRRPASAGSKYKSANAAAKAGVVGFTRAISQRVQRIRDHLQTTSPPGHMEKHTQARSDWDQTQEMGPGLFRPLDPRARPGWGAGGAPKRSPNHLPVPSPRRRAATSRARRSRFNGGMVMV